MVLLGERTSLSYATLRASDSRGDVELESRNEPGPDYQKSVQWFVARPTSGDVVVRYDEPVFTQSVVPSFTLVSEAEAIFGAGMTFMVVPADAGQPYRIHLQWDLSGMPAGSLGVWAFGEGSVEHIGRPSDLQETWYESGVLHRYVRGHFGVYSAAAPDFDMQEYAERAAKTFRYYQEFFERSPGSYRVFLHAEPLGGSGTSLVQSFLETYNPHQPESVMGLYHTLAHEMAHTFLPHVYPEQEDELAAWFNEGSAEYYSAVLPFRAGFTSPSEFLESINASMRDYYWAPSRALSIRQAARAGFFKANDVQQIAYGRGRFFLAQVNEEIRAASHGQHSLDEITRKIGALERQGKSHGEDVWLRLVRQQIGPKFSEQFSEFMAGKLVVPPSDAFGPCFRRERADIPRFDLGFAASGLIGQRPVIRHLVAGSPAAEAGAREGDEVISYTPLNRLYRNLTARMTLRVKRGSKTEQIGYLPRGGLIKSYRWVRVSGVPEALCRKI